MKGFYDEKYWCGMRVIIAERTIRVRNKTSKFKLIDKLYEKLFGYSEIKSTHMPDDVDAYVIKDAIGGNVLLVRNSEVLDKMEAAVKEVSSRHEGGDK